MFRIGLFVFCLSVMSCGNDNTTERDDGVGIKQFSESFKEVTLPYEISDTALLKFKDTTHSLDNRFEEYLPDSIKKFFVKEKAVVRYVPIARVDSDEEQYFVVKATSEKNAVALLYVFDKAGNFGAAFPFLVPDSDPTTIQVSGIDKVKSISRGITKQVSAEEIREGKDVYAYSRATKSFSLIMTDVLDDDKLELINPIDTLPKTHPLAGDYVQGKKSVVSLRDGRKANELQFFIHFEKANGDCTGELKGTALFTSSKTAVYREGGDPCVLEIHFSPSAVSLKEVEGCGAHRGLDCAFDGKFTRKKTASSSTQTKK